MFGQNEIVGKKHFAHAPEDSLFVTSIFYTLQGEGPFMGRPAIFLRLAKCNLACDFCDTYFDVGQWMTFDEIRAKICQVLIDHWTTQSTKAPLWAIELDAGGRAYHPGVILVITGGEPMLQHNLLDFCSDEQVYWKNIQIESNGTTTIEGISDYATVVISPKCVDKGEGPIKYLNVSAAVVLEAHCLKFVLSADPKSPYHTIPDWAFLLEDIDVYVSPMNMYLDQPKSMKIAVLKGSPTLEERSTIIEKVSFWDPGILDLEANRANHEWAAKYALDHGLLLNLQMHLYASLP